MPLPDLVFDDGVSSIDYVLVSREVAPDSPNYEENEARRFTFENNLREEGLHLEEDKVEEVPLRWVFNLQLALEKKDC